MIVDWLLLDLKEVRGSVRVCETVWVGRGEKETKDHRSDEYGETRMGFDLETTEDIEYLETGI